MQTNPLGKTGLEISRLGLGTVEIGLAYDITDKRIPTDQEAEHILKTAVELGFTYIDTARGYGVAEERIGKFGITKLPNVVVGTKCAQFLEKGEDPARPELEKRIREEIETSLTNLKTDSLQLVQLHGGTEEQINRGDLIETMQSLKDEGKVQHVGIATRGEDAPLAALQVQGEPRPDGRAAPFFETIQTAYSIADQRMASQVLPEAKNHQVGLINRSVLLKGALTPKRSVLPDHLQPLKSCADQAEKIAQEAGIDLPSLAFRFVLSNPAISTVLIGTIKPHHLESAIAAAEAGPLSQDILDELHKLAISDPNQVDPSNW